MKCQTVSVGEAAQLLGLAKPTIYAAVKRGELPAVRIGDRVLIPKTALRRMLGRLDEPAVDGQQTGERAEATRDAQ